MISDPESRVMKDGATKRFLQTDNSQIAVDGAHQCIVAHSVTQQENGGQQLTPMREWGELNLPANRNW
jgi:hypothetical protein